MAFSKVSVLVPTRRRIQRLRTLLESYARTTNGARAASELVFRVDDDDDDTRRFMGVTRHVMIVGPRLQGYASMPVFFNEMAARATGDVLMCGNDDMVFRTRHWAPAILAAANEFPDGLFDLGVATHNETHYPFSTVSKRAAEHLGFLWDPAIFWGDIFLRDTMAAFGRCVMLPHVQVDHDWAGNRPDAVFMEADKDIALRDPTYWTGTHAAAVGRAVAKLRELRA